MTRLTRKNDALPECPHCDAALEDCWYRELKGGQWGRRYVYFCARCRKVLGVSHRKGFWMG